MNGQGNFPVVWCCLPAPAPDIGTGLVTAEEVALGSLYSDQDAVYWGSWLAATIDSLSGYFPDDTPFPTDSIYRIDHLTCGEPVNMGYMDIVNPMRNLTYTLSYIEHHFLANGSFSSFIDDYSETTRIDISELKPVLFPYDSDHQLAISGDADSDAIPDSIEHDFFQLNPGDWDTDDAGIPDAAQLTEQLSVPLPALMTHQDSLHTR